MDPISVIVTAVVLGIAAGAENAAAQAVKDAYAGLKKIIQDKYKVHLANLEKKPDSPSQRGAVEENLRDTDAANDPDLLERAAALVKAVKEAGAQGEVVGVDLKEVEAELIRIRDVQSTGTGVKAENIKAKKLDFRNIKAGATDKTDPK